MSLGFGIITDVVLLLVQSLLSTSVVYFTGTITHQCGKAMMLSVTYAYKQITAMALQRA